MTMQDTHNQDKRNTGTNSLKDVSFSTSIIKALDLTSSDFSLSKQELSAVDGLFRNLMTRVRNDWEDGRTDINLVKETQEYLKGITRGAREAIKNATNASELSLHALPPESRYIEFLSCMASVDIMQFPEKTSLNEVIKFFEDYKEASPSEINDAVEHARKTHTWHIEGSAPVAIEPKPKERVASNKKELVGA